MIDAVATTTTTTIIDRHNILEGNEQPTTEEITTTIQTDGIKEEDELEIEMTTKAAIEVVATVLTMVMTMVTTMVTTMQKTNWAFRDPQEVQSPTDSIPTSEPSSTKHRPQGPTYPPPRHPKYYGHLQKTVWIHCWPVSNHQSEHRPSPRNRPPTGSTKTP